MKNYFYSLLCKYLSLYIFKEDKVVSIEPVNGRVSQRLQQVKIAVRKKMENAARCSRVDIAYNEVNAYRPDYILLDGARQYSGAL